MKDELDKLRRRLFWMWWVIGILTGLLVAKIIITLLDK